MSEESNEIDKILAEGFGDHDLDVAEAAELVEEILETGPPYIFLSLDSPFYLAGDRLQGEIMLEVPKSLGPASLHLTAHGSEEAHIFLQNQPICQANKKVFSLSSSLKSWETLPRGSFLLPFSFKIPHYSPPTFYYSGQDSASRLIKAQVSYSISAKLCFQSEEITHSQTLIIRSKDSRSSPHVGTEQTEVVAGICCSSKGTSNFKLEVTSTQHPTVNSFINFKLVPDNGNCAAPINQVVSDIVMELEVREGDRSYVVRDVVVTIPRITWIAAFTSLVFEKDFEFTAEMKGRGEDLNAGSIDTNLIKCRYMIEVKIYYDLKFRAEPARIYRNFHVEPADNITRDVPKLPASWGATPEPGIALIVEEN